MVRVLEQDRSSVTPMNKRMRYDAATTIPVSSISTGRRECRTLLVVEEALADMFVSIRVEIPYHNGATNSI
jgi:hypothetical protein